MEADKQSALGCDRITTAPLIFTSLDLKHSIWIVHLGSEVCGHEGIVHGGLLAALLDDSLARTVSMLFALRNVTLPIVQMHV